MCGVISKSDFFGDVKRAKLFEETDNEIAVLRVTIPEDEFLMLKEEAKSGSPLPGMQGGNGGFQPPQGGMGGFPFPGGNNGNNGGFQPPQGGNNGNNNGGFQPPQGGMGGFQFPGGNGDNNGGFQPPQGGMGGFKSKDSFKTKNATMIVEINK